MGKINWSRVFYGAGPAIAAGAGLAAWVLGTLLPNAAFMWALGLFPTDLTVMTTAGGVVESILGALAGAALYKEAADAARSSTAAAS